MKKYVCWLLSAVVLPSSLSAVKNLSEGFQDWLEEKKARSPTLMRAPLAEWGSVERVGAVFLRNDETFKKKSDQLIASYVCHWSSAFIMLQSWVWAQTEVSKPENLPHYITEMRRLIKLAEAQAQSRGIIIERLILKQGSQK